MKNDHDLNKDEGKSGSNGRLLVYAEMRVFLLLALVSCSFKFCGTLLEFQELASFFPKLLAVYSPISERSQGEELDDDCDIDSPITMLLLSFRVLTAVIAGD